MRTIPMLTDNALQSYEGVAGVFRINVPNGTMSPVMVLDAKGTFAFGGIDRLNTEIYITKIVIDGSVVLDKNPGDYLTSVFSNNTDSMENVIAGNTPPFLVNDSIQIYAVNYANGNKHDNTLVISLVPID